jgi:hypothetical protein
MMYQKQGERPVKQADILSFLDTQIKFSLLGEPTHHEDVIKRLYDDLISENTLLRQELAKARKEIRNLKKKFVGQYTGVTNIEF